MLQFLSVIEGVFVAAKDPEAVLAPVSAPVSSPDSVPDLVAITDPGGSPEPVPVPVSVIYPINVRLVLP